MLATAVALCTLCSTLDLHHSLVPATCGGPEKKAAGVVVWRETVSTNGVSQLMLVDHASAAVFLLYRASDPGAQRGKAARPPQVGRARGGASEAGLGTVLGAKFLRQPGASKTGIIFSSILMVTGVCRKLQRSVFFREAGCGCGVWAGKRGKSRLETEGPFANY